MLSRLPCHTKSAYVTVLALPDQGPPARDYDVQRVKVTFEGNVEYVLGNTHITDIEVDGGNRKWIATANAGILLLSADGSEILEQHTTENSPLISNNIFDLKLAIYDAYPNVESQKQLKSKIFK